MVPVVAHAQTLGGRLLGRGTDRPIELAVVTMVEETGDRVAVTITDDLGRFSLTSPKVGSFYLTASAFGYETSSAGIFDLGRDAEMTVDFRVEPRPVAVEGLSISTHANESRRNLVASGFLDRLSRGIGKFITPFEIENSRARSTVELFEGIPSVSLANLKRSSTTSRVIVLRGTGAAAACYPRYYLDGAAIDLGTDELNAAVPIEASEAIEIYSGASEIPAQYLGDLPTAGWCVDRALWRDRDVDEETLAGGSSSAFSRGLGGKGSPRGT